MSSPVPGIEVPVLVDLATFEELIKASRGTCLDDVSVWDYDASGAHAFGPKPESVQFEAELDGIWLASLWEDVATLPAWAKDLAHAHVLDHEHREDHRGY
jgi:hypothetical protein